MERKHDRETDPAFDGELSDDALTEGAFRVLHLPPGLDLLLAFLDSADREATTSTGPTPIVPVPYPRTPTLG